MSSGLTEYMLVLRTSHAENGGNPTGHMLDRSKFEEAYP